MKILFYIHSLNKGGAERVLLTIAEELNKDDGYEIVILTDTVDESEYELPEGLRRIVMDAEGGDLDAFGRLNAIRGYIKAEKPDETVVFMLSSVIRAVVALAGTGYRVTAAVRSNPYDDYAGGMNRILLMWAMRRTKRIVCQTGYQAEFFRGSLRDKCVIISNPIFGEFAEMAAICGSDTRRVSQGKIAASGRLYDYKNHKLLIRAFKRISDRYPNAYTVIYGDGPYRSELEAEINRLDLTGRVRLAGESANVAKDISDADIYVLPSDTEGLPNALMEAMALSLPVISTDCPCGGPGSLINDGVNGLLVPVDDVERMAKALARLMDDVDLRKKLGRNAAGILKTNSTQKITADWKKLWTQSG